MRHHSDPDMTTTDEPEVVIDSDDGSVDDDEPTKWEDDEPEPVSDDVAIVGVDAVEDAVEDPDVDDGPDPDAALQAVPELEDQGAVRYVRFCDLRTEFRLWTNPRSFTGLDDESIGELAASIKHHTRQDAETGALYAGVQDPLKVVPILVNGEVILLVVDGQRRYRATRIAVAIDDALVPVIFQEPEPVAWTRELADKYLLSALEGVGTRSGLSSYELSESAERLRSSKDPETGKDFTLAKIARAVARSESWVSKILTARGNASEKLILQWKRGEVTDEQFKELASITNAKSQAAAADAVTEARKGGDKGAARTLAKEQKAKVLAKAAAPPKASKGTNPTVRGPQVEMPPVPPKKAPPFAVVEDTLGLAAKNPPTHDYVKGVMDGIRWDRGLLDAAQFAKPWHAYITHVAGGAVAKAPSKATPKTGKAKAKAKAKKLKRG